MQKAEDPLSRGNYAVALGITGDSRAAEVLKEIVQSRDRFFFTDGRRSNQFRSAVAICLLGRLGGKECIPLLEEILDDREIQRKMYHTLKPNYLYYPHSDRNFVYFDHLTHSCAALVKLYRRHGLDLSFLHRKFETLFSGDTFLRRITDTRPGEPTYEEIQNFTDLMLKITG